MDEENGKQEVVQQIVDEVLSSIEPLDTQGAALVQFLKAKGIVSDEEFAPYLEQAGKASGVRWLAVRVRVNSLIASALKNAEAKPADTKPPQQQADSATAKDDSESIENSSKQDQETAAAGERRESADQEGKPEKPTPTAEKDENRKENHPITSGETEKKDAAQSASGTPGVAISLMGEVSAG